MHSGIVDILAAPWAIEPEKLREMTAVYSLRLQGETEAEQAERIEEAEANAGRKFSNQRQPYDVISNVAVIGLNGVMGKRMNLLMRISGGTSTSILAGEILQAQNDPDVHSLIISVDSPGGMVDGTEALANLIFDARAGKPMVAFADGTMASAAYIAPSAAHRIFSSGHTARVGSIGVVQQHIDRSQRNAREGIVVTEFTAGKYKRITSENFPLSQEGGQVIQNELDHIYVWAVDTVGKNRGKSSEAVLRDMADGRIFIGRQAVTAGLIDGFSTIPELVAMLNREFSAKSRAFVGGL